MSVEQERLRRDLVDPLLLFEDPSESSVHDVNVVLVKILQYLNRIQSKTSEILDDLPFEGLKSSMCAFLAQMSRRCVLNA